jgi:hypothetical protein
VNGDVRKIWITQQQLARKIDRWVYLDEHSDYLRLLNSLSTQTSGIVHDTRQT